jgi:hypothetical protein
MTPVWQLVIQIIALIVTIWIAEKAARKRHQDGILQAVKEALGERVSRLENADRDRIVFERIISSRVTACETKHEDRHPSGQRSVVERG